MRIRLLRGLVLLAAIFSVGATAWGQSYPDKPLRVIIPHGAGSSPDVVTRLVAQKLSAQIGQPVLVENKVGAGGSIGMGQAARAVPAVRPRGSRRGPMSDAGGQGPGANSRSIVLSIRWQASA